MDMYCLLVKIEYLRGENDDLLREMKFLVMGFLGLMLGWRGVRE